MAPISLSPLWATKPPQQIPFFFQKKLFHSKISGAFLHISISNFITYRDCLDFRIIKVNFDDSYFYVRLHIISLAKPIGHFRTSEFQKPSLSK